MCYYIFVINEIIRKKGLLWKEGVVVETKIIETEKKIDSKSLWLWDY